MCFISESDWLASVVERSSGPAKKESPCDECQRPILVGRTRHALYMQEADECLPCEHGDCACVGDCCQCAEPSVGETFDWQCCDDCDRFLLAVKLAEMESGCRESESLPALGSMRSDISDGGMDEAKKYWKKAVEMFQELKASGYLGWLWRETFGVGARA